MNVDAAKPTGFWNRPATWKPFLLIAAYLAFYLAVSWLIGRVLAGRVDTDDVMADASGIFFGLAPAIGIGGLALLTFTWRVGWLRAIFGRSPVRGRGWMWIAPVLVAAAIAGHTGAIDWAAWSGGQIAMMAVVGVCVGVTEELATRGLAVKMLRDAGHGERSVAVLSSLLFGLMHAVNLLSGMDIGTVVTTIVYAFGFGMCMYLAMCVTGSIWAAIILHALTDPTTFLSTGGIDHAVTGRELSGWDAMAAVATYALVLFGVAAAFFVKGRTTTAPPVSTRD